MGEEPQAEAEDEEDEDEDGGDMSKYKLDSDEVRTSCHGVYLSCVMLEVIVPVLLFIIPA